MSTSSKKDSDRPAARQPPSSDADWFRVADSSTSGLPDRSRSKPPAFPEIAGYEFQEELGRSTAGDVVFKARDKQHDRIVALRLLRSSRSAEAEARKRFLNSTEMLARLSHPNIVGLLAVGEYNGCPFVTHEYVASPSLGQWMVRTAPAPHQSAIVLEQLARAMQHAHERGIVHGDLRPGNILMVHGDLAEPSPDASRHAAVPAIPKIVDLGLANLPPAGQTWEGGRSGAVPEYAAPEQSREPAGPAADIYSLGAIFYHMLVGHPPFAGATAAETTLLAQTDEPIPPRRFRPHTPPDLETICLKCLEKEPAQRYVSAGSLADDLARVLASEPIWARPRGPLTRFCRWRRANRSIANLLLLTLGALALLATAGWALAFYLLTKL